VREFLNSNRNNEELDARFALDKKKRNPLHIACMEGHNALAEYLLKEGFNPNSRDSFLKTPLHYAALHSNDYIVEVLL